jgi:hypothetical protein
LIKQFLLPDLGQVAREILLDTLSIHTTLRRVFDVGLFRLRDPCRGDARPSPRLVGWFSGDFDFDLLRLCFLALGQMDL